MTRELRTAYNPLITDHSFGTPTYHPAAMKTERQIHDTVDATALKGRRGLRRVLNAARYSIDGVRAAWKSEDAFRQEVLLAAAMIPVAFVLPVSIVEKILLIGVVLLVLIVELLNTAVEAAIDRDSTEINSLGKQAKDLGSAAVMLSLVLAGGTWAAILLSHFA